MFHEKKPFDEARLTVRSFEHRSVEVKHRMLDNHQAQHE